MTALKITLQVIVVLLSFVLTLLILMHKGKGGGLSDMFGGGLTQNAGTSGVAEKNLNRWTVIIALVWVALIIGLDMMTKFNLADRLARHIDLSLATMTVTVGHGSYAFYRVLRKDITMVTMNRNKVVIVGTGRVGATAAFGIVTHGLCNELVLIDCSAAKALGEARDLDDGSEFQDRHVKVRAGDYADCKDADIVVITVGRKPPANSNRMAELGFTVGLVGEVVDNVMASGFDGVIVMVSNPVDVMAWYAWKRSGLPRTQVLGTGTALDTSRLKTIIGEETGLDPRNVGGFVMGEHGDSQFTAWSTVSLGGKPFARFLADNQDRFASVSTTEIEEKTRTRGNEIVAAKGGTNFGIASTVAGIVQTILWDERRIVPVSTLLDGEYGEHDVFLGVPTELRANGANEIVELDLSEDERAKLHHSAELVREHCEGLL